MAFGEVGSGLRCNGSMFAAAEEHSALHCVGLVNNLSAVTLLTGKSAEFRQMRAMTPCLCGTARPHPPTPPHPKKGVPGYGGLKGSKTKNSLGDHFLS